MQYLVAWQPPRPSAPYSRSLGAPQPSWRFGEGDTEEAAMAAANPPPGATIYVASMDNVSKYTRDETPGFSPA